jgi:hypothetical protein
VVAHERTPRDVRSTLPVHLRQTGQAVRRQCVCLTLALAPSRTGLEGRHKRAGTRTSRRVCIAGTRCWGWAGRGGCQRGRGGPEVCSSRARPPWPRRPQHGAAWGRASEDAATPPLPDELACPFTAIPWGEAPASRLGSLARHAPHRARPRGGTNRPWRLDQGPQRARPGGEPARAWPTGARGAVARQRCGPPGHGRAHPPGAGGSAPAARAQRPWWLPAASVPRGRGRYGAGPCARRSGGHVPACSPPSGSVGPEEERRACDIEVRYL